MGRLSRSDQAPAGLPGGFCRTSAGRFRSSSSAFRGFQGIMGPAERTQDAHHTHAGSLNYPATAIAIVLMPLAGGRAEHAAFAARRPPRPI